MTAAATRFRPTGSHRRARAAFDVLRAQMLRQQFRGAPAPKLTGYRPAAKVGASLALSAAQINAASFAALLSLVSAADVSVPEPLGANAGTPAAEQTQQQQQSSSAAAASAGDAADVPHSRVATSLVASLAPRRSQMIVRCTSCRASLALPSLVDGSASSFESLSRQRPTMFCCPACRKSLPSCALCLLPLGCVNPVLQLRADLAERQALATRAALAEAAKLESALEGRDGTAADGAGSSTSSDAGGPRDGVAAPSLNLGAAIHSVPFADTVSRHACGVGRQWCRAARVIRTSCAVAYTLASALPRLQWSWCASCKHGGHASHLLEWFSSRDVCPVAACSCNCVRQDGHHGEATLRGKTAITQTGTRGLTRTRWGLDFQGGKMPS